MTTKSARITAASPAVSQSVVRTAPEGTSPGASRARAHAGPRAAGTNIVCWISAKAVALPAGTPRRASRYAVTGVPALAA